jgi:hypothetical protein
MTDHYVYGQTEASYDRFHKDKHYGAIAFEPISSSVQVEQEWQSPIYSPPITLEAVKEYLRCEDSADDSLITSLMTAAVAYVQEVTGVVFVYSRINNRYSSFPSQSQSLSVTPELISGSSLVATSLTLTYPSKATNSLVVLSLIDGDFTYAVVNNYALLIPSAAGWPVDDFDTKSPLGVSLQAHTLTATPTSSGNEWQQLLVAVKMLVGHWYANREAVSDARLAEVPMGVQMLLQNQTSHRGMF